MSDLNVYSTTAAVNALTPVDGDMVVDTEANAVKVYCNGAWKVFNNDSTAVPNISNRWAGSFTGGDVYLNLPTSVLNSYASPGSISAWIKPSSLTGGGSNPWEYRSIISKGNVYLNLGLNSSGYPHVYWHDGVVLQGITGTTQASTTDWMHVCLTWTTTGPTKTRLYVNGNEEGNSTVSIADIPAGQEASAAYIGQTHAAGSEFTGLIDEIGVFSSELSEPDVLALQTSNDLETLFPTSLVNWYRFGDDDSDSPSEGGKIVTLSDTKGGATATQGGASSQPPFSDLTGETIYV